MKLPIVLLLSLSLCLRAASIPELTHIIVAPAIVLGVHDGDTLTVAATGVPNWVGSVRLKNVRAMELGSEGGGGARANLLRLLPVGSQVRVRFELTNGGNPIKSLCRPIVEIWVVETGLNVNETQTAYLKANNWWGGKDIPLDARD